MKGLSVIVPAYNEEGSIALLIKKISSHLAKHKLRHEIIIVDDRSTDKTAAFVNKYAKKYPITLLRKRGTKGKAFSLLEGFENAKYDTLAMIDADLQYPPEMLYPMYLKSMKDVDIVVANRVVEHGNIIRKITSNVFKYIFGNLLHKLDVDVQSGLKVLKKEAIERINIRPSAWSFDLEFLLKARDAGYSIGSVTIPFTERNAGTSHVNIFTTSIELIVHAIKMKFRPYEVIPLHGTLANSGFHFRGKKFIPYTNLHHSQMAIYQFVRHQKIFISLLLLVIIFSLIIHWKLTITALVATLTLIYFVDLVFNVFLIYRSFANSNEITIEDKDVKKVKKVWPSYTVFCPLYKEWSVVPQFIKAMSQLDYPREKLQVMLLLEEDDVETIKKVQTFKLPSYFETVIVPHSMPKTKPKAMNYGLQFAKGEFIVIYDAEDKPDPLQLKKAVMAFNQLGAKTACIQAKLNFYNPSQNIITRIFTGEYSLWFDLVLTGLQSIDAPIPLGGTSNHFRTADIKKLKGWDAFNVTEDADLGIRLQKMGYKTAIIDSTTYEEANSDGKNWIQQRSRWIKGYVQTYLIHMRSPLKLIKEWNFTKFFAFQLIIGGKILSMLINPFMWAITISYFSFRPFVGATIEEFYPMPILYMGVVCLVFGNFLYMYYYLAGCAKRKYYDNIKFMFLVPFYWLAMSYAASIAIHQVITKPHYWAKTIHGLHLKKEKKKVSLKIRDLFNPPAITKVLPRFNVSFRTTQ